VQEEWRKERIDLEAPYVKKVDYYHSPKELEVSAVPEAHKLRIRESEKRGRDLDRYEERLFKNAIRDGRESEITLQIPLVRNGRKVESHSRIIKTAPKVFCSETYSVPKPHSGRGASSLYVHHVSAREIHFENGASVFEEYRSDGGVRQRTTYSHRGVGETEFFDDNGTLTKTAVGINRKNKPLDASDIRKAESECRKETRHLWKESRQKAGTTVKVEVRGKFDIGGYKRKESFKRKVRPYKVDEILKRVASDELAGNRLREDSTRLPEDIPRDIKEDAAAWKTYRLQSRADSGINCVGNGSSK